MSLRQLQAVLLLILLALPFRVQAADLSALGTALRLDAVIDVMRAEGIKYGEELDAELLGGSGGLRWDGLVEAIYDPARMRGKLDAVFMDELADRPAEVDAIMEFIGSGQGQSILALEVSARKALLDPAVDEASKVMFDDMVHSGDPRLKMLRRFAEVNDLIESNVVGAMNSNYAFYRGLADGGAFGDRMTDADILADVWSQEPDIRRETEEWLYPYLALAYQPLPDEDLEAYIAFSLTHEGHLLNAVLFAAFDDMFTAISHDLGLAAAQILKSQDI